MLVRNIPVSKLFIVESWDETYSRFWFHKTSSIKLEIDDIFINGALCGYLEPVDGTPYLVKQLTDFGFTQLHEPTPDECSQLCSLS